MLDVFRSRICRTEFPGDREEDAVYLLKQKKKKKETNKYVCLAESFDPLGRHVG